jgi:hypothetical protein
MYIIIMGPLGAWVPDGRTSCPPLDRPLETALERRKKRKKQRKARTEDRFLGTNLEYFQYLSSLLLTPLNE